VAGAAGAAGPKSPASPEPMQLYIYMIHVCVLIATAGAKSRAYQKFLSHYLLMPFTWLFVIIIQQLGRFICQMFRPPSQPAISIYLPLASMESIEN